VVTAFDEDVDDDEGRPDWLSCNGSRWVLRIDHNGVRHESDLRQPS
jgi:hypothetical protein